MSYIELTPDEVLALNRNEAPHRGDMTQDEYVVICAEDLAQQLGYNNYLICHNHDIRWANTPDKNVQKLLELKYKDIWTALYQWDYLIAFFKERNDLIQAKVMLGETLYCSAD